MTMIVLTAGRFGKAVATHLAVMEGIESASLTQDRHDLEVLVARASFVGVATWRPYLERYDVVDQLCFAHGTRWSLAEIHGRRLTIGPTVVPGRGTCYGCYHKRWLCGHPAPEREAVLQYEFGRNDNIGPEGFIDPLVKIAAHGLLAARDGGPAAAGRLQVIDVLTASVQESKVVGVHECPRCRPPAAGRTGERFVRSLVPVVEDLFR